MMLRDGLRPPFLLIICSFSKAMTIKKGIYLAKLLYDNLEEVSVLLAIKSMSLYTRRRFHYGMYYIIPGCFPSVSPAITRHIAQRGFTNICV